MTVKKPTELPSADDRLREAAARLVFSEPDCITYPARGVYGGKIAPETPFWSEGALYELVGKEAARTLLAWRKEVARALADSSTDAFADELVGHILDEPPKRRPNAYVIRNNEVAEVLKDITKPRGRCSIKPFQATREYRGKRQHVVGYTWSRLGSHYATGRVYEAILGCGATFEAALEHMRKKVKP